MSQVTHRSPTARPREDESLEQDGPTLGPHSVEPRAHGGPAATTEPAVVPRGEELLNNITSLLREARTATDLRRPGMVGALNAQLARLPAEVDPAAASALLQRLLEHGGLAGLEDEEGLPSHVAATRALMELGYPHALEVAPEQLEAMRRWTRRLPSVPWALISLALFAAFVMQIFFVTMDSRPPRYPELGEPGHAMQGVTEPTGMAALSAFMWDTGKEVFQAQFMSNFGAFVLSLTVGRSRKWRWVPRRVFLGIGVLGLLVGSLQLTASPFLMWTTFASAAGSLVSAWLLKDE